MVRFAVLALGLIAVLGQSEADAQVRLKGPPKIGFIFSSNNGATVAQERARLALQTEFEQPIPFAANTPPREAADAAERLIGDGANVIVGGGNYTEAFTLEAGRHPDVAFVDLAGTGAAVNLLSITPKSFEGWYLAGLAAGTATKSRMLGIIAQSSAPESLWAVNAFALGARAVSPHIVVVALFTKDDTDPAGQARLADKLLDQGADVIVASSPAALGEAEKAGRFSIGEYNDLASAAPKGIVTSVVVEWASILAPLVKRMAAGQFTGGEPMLPGINEGALDLTRPTALVKPLSLLNIATARKQIMSGGFFPFTGPIRAQGGVLKVADGQVMGPDDLRQMGFLVENVRGSLQ